MDNQILDSDFITTAEAPNLILASKGKRFGNYLIDTIFAYMTIILFVMIIVPINPSLVESMAENGNGTPFIDYVFGYIAMFLYYFASESLLKGRSIGKFVTGTRAVRFDHDYITTGDAAKRSLCRLVPFDALSFLGSYGYGWHDKWTDTMVVNEKEFKQYYGESI